MLCCLVSAVPDQIDLFIKMNTKKPLTEKEKIAFSKHFQTEFWTGPHVVAYSIDGARFAGKDAKSIVNQFAKSCIFVPSKDIYEYMEQYADRAKVIRPESNIRVTNPDTFLNDLNAEGWIRLEYN